MKTAVHCDSITRARALQALKTAVMEGMVWRYDHVVAQALAAGATDEEIDTTAHEAVVALLAQAEQPFTARELCRR